jgi:hypothetical protein
MYKYPNIPEKYTQLLFVKWIFRYNDYQNKIDFHWRGNYIHVDIHSHTPNGGKDRLIFIDFYINDKHTQWRFGLNCYGAGTRGEAPVVESDGHRLIFLARALDLEIGEHPVDEKTKASDYPFHADKDGEESWFPIFEKFTSNYIGMIPFHREDGPIWVKKVFSKMDSKERCLFEYKLHDPKKWSFNFTSGNFTILKIYDYDNTGDRKYHSVIACLIEDCRCDRFFYYFPVKGIEVTTILEILKFVDSLQYYQNWEEYNSSQS